MQFMTEAKFKELVLKARSFVVNYDLVRWKIADLAIEACDIIHGGGKRNNVFSLARFSKEIGIKPKTLTEWVRMKRNVINKLPIKIQEKIKDIPLAVIRDTNVNVKNDSTDKEVLAIYKKAACINPAVYRWQKYILHMKSILFNASKPNLLVEIPDNEIKEMIKISKMISAYLENELEFRDDNKKPSGVTNIERIQLVREKLNQVSW